MMGNTFYFSDKFNISDYDAESSILTFKIPKNVLFLNEKWRTLLDFIQFMKDEPNDEILIFSRYFTALQFEYSPIRSKMLSILNRTDTLYIQIRYQPFIDKILQNEADYLTIDKRYLRYFNQNTEGVHNEI
jgi:hypothetical protein